MARVLCFLLPSGGLSIRGKDKVSRRVGVVAEEQWLVLQVERVELAVATVMFLISCII